MNTYAVPIYEIRRAIRVVEAESPEDAQATAEGHRGYGTIIATNEWLFWDGYHKDEIEAVEIDPETLQQVTDANSV